MGTQAYPSHPNLPQRARSTFARTEHSLEEGELISLRATSTSSGWLDKHLAFRHLHELITCLSEVLRGRMEPPLCTAGMLKTHCYIGFSLPPPSYSLTSVSSGNIFADQLPGPDNSPIKLPMQHSARLPVGSALRGRPVSELDLKMDRTV